MPVYTDSKVPTYIHADKYIKTQKTTHAYIHANIQRCKTHKYIHIKMQKTQKHLHTYIQTYCCC